MASIRIEEDTVPYIEDNWSEWEEKLFARFPDFQRKEVSLLAEESLPDFAAREAAADVDAVASQMRLRRLKSIRDKMRRNTDDFSPITLPEPIAHLARQNYHRTQPLKMGMAASRCLSRVRR